MKNRQLGILAGAALLCFTSFSAGAAQICLAFQDADGNTYCDTLKLDVTGPLGTSMLVTGSYDMLCGAGAPAAMTGTIIADLFASPPAYKVALTAIDLVNTGAGAMASISGDIGGPWAALITSSSSGSTPLANNGPKLNQVTCTFAAATTKRMWEDAH